MIHGSSGTSAKIIWVPNLPWIMARTRAAANDAATDRWRAATRGRAWGQRTRARPADRKRGPRAGGSVVSVRYTGSYAVVLVLHLLTVVFVVGPLAVTAVTASRLVRAGDVVALRAAGRTTRLFSIATVVTVVQIGRAHV